MSRAFTLGRFSVDEIPPDREPQRQINLSNSERGGKNARERRDHISELTCMCVQTYALNVCVKRALRETKRDMHAPGTRVSINFNRREKSRRVRGKKGEGRRSRRGGDKYRDI